MKRNIPTVCFINIGINPSKCKSENFFNNIQLYNEGKFPTLLFWILNEGYKEREEMESGGIHSKQWSHAAPSYINWNINQLYLNWKMRKLDCCNEWFQQKTLFILHMLLHMCSTSQNNYRRAKFLKLISSKLGLSCLLFC